MNSYIWVASAIQNRLCICEKIFLCSCADATHTYRSATGWQRPIGCLKLQVVFAKEPLIIGFFGGKWPVKTRHPMGLRHPVCESHQPENYYIPYFLFCIWLSFYFVCVLVSCVCRACFLVLMQLVHTALLCASREHEIYCVAYFLFCIRPSFLRRARALLYGLFSILYVS